LRGFSQESFEINWRPRDAKIPIIGTIQPTKTAKSL